MSYSQDQLEKLPKWAQLTINRLESETVYLNKRLDEYTGRAETNTFIRNGLDLVQLPNNANISFRAGEKKENKVDVYVNRDGFIDVNTDSPYTTVIMPRAANSFYIAFIKEEINRLKRL